MMILDAKTISMYRAKLQDAIDEYPGYWSVGDLVILTRIPNLLIEQMAALDLVESEPTYDKSFLFKTDEIKTIWVTRETLYKSSQPLDLMAISEARLKAMKEEVSLAIEEGKYWSNESWINTVAAVVGELDDARAVLTT